MSFNNWGSNVKYEFYMPLVKKNVEIKWGVNSGGVNNCNYGMGGGQQLWGMWGDGGGGVNS